MGAFSKAETKILTFKKDYPCQGKVFIQKKSLCHITLKQILLNLY